MIPFEARSITARLARAFAFAALMCAAGTSARAQASIALAKTVYVGQDGGASCAGAGELARADLGIGITFCFRIENTGNQALTGVTLNDPDLPFSSAIGNLAVGQVATRFFETTVTTNLLNSASVTGFDQGAPVLDSDTARVDALAACPSTCYLVSDVGNNAGPDNLYLFDLNTAATTFLGAIRPIPASGIDANCLEALTFAPPQFGVQFPLLYSVDDANNCGNVANAGFLGVIDYVNATNSVVPWIPLPNPIGIGRGARGNRNLSDVDAMSFDASLAGNNILYAAVRISDNGIPADGNEEDLLIQIDHTTGRVIQDAFGPGVDYLVLQAVTNSLGQVLADVDDFAFDNKSGQLWAIANASGLTDELVSFDKTTGLVVLNQGVPVAFPCSPPMAWTDSRTWKA